MLNTVIKKIKIRIKKRVVMLHHGLNIWCDAWSYFCVVLPWTLRLGRWVSQGIPCNCWAFVPAAPIPQKGSGSTTTTMFCISDVADNVLVKVIFT